jgi:hypothetical protein
LCRFTDSMPKDIMPISWMPNPECRILNPEFLGLNAEFLNQEWDWMPKGTECRNPLCRIGLNPEILYPELDLMPNFWMPNFLMPNFWMPNFLMPKSWMPNWTECRNFECRNGLNAEFFLNAKFLKAVMNWKPKFRKLKLRECWFRKFEIWNAELDWRPGGTERRIF